MDAIALVPRRRLLVAIAVALTSSGATAATIAVDSNDDSPLTTFCNLREAITSINNAGATANCSATVTGTFGDNDTIVFAPPLADSVITLEQGRLMITKPMTLTGSGETIDADGKSTAVYIDGGALTASDLSVQNGNAAVAGGIEVFNGTLTMHGVTLAYNHGGNGGAIATGGQLGGAVTLSGAFIHDNTAQSSGGAIFVGVGGSLAVTDCILADNSALSGGAIFGMGFSTGTVVTGSTISGNAASQGGGAIFTRAPFDIRNSTLTSNTATGQGGAIYATGKYSVGLRNVTVSGNTAAIGGAMYFKQTYDYFGTARLNSFNSIVSANSAAIDDDLSVSGYFTLTGNNNLFGSSLNVPPYNDAANNNVFTNAPYLGPLQNNGGFTDTMALLTGSPAIDAGSNDSAAALTTDQRGTGFPRVVNGTVDIGAYEFGDHIFADGFESGP